MISEKVRNILIVLIVLICAIIVGYYKVDINHYIDKTSDNLQLNDSSNTKEVKLIKCIDGDTVKLLIDDKAVKVRLLAIDTPEIKHPKKSEESYAKTASIHTCDSLTNAKKITISYEKNIFKQDKYKRDLVWLYADDKLVQEELISQGLARVRYIYGKYKYTEKLLKIEKEAKEKQVGIWHDYKDKVSNNDYVVVYDYGDSSSSSKVENNYITKIPDNPTKEGYIFVGWTYNNKLYDLSNPITANIVLTPKFYKL